MPIITGYLLRDVLKNASMIILVALVALLLERSLRIMELVSPSGQLITYSLQMLASLVPHYFGIALPTALFGGVLLTFNRLKRDGELSILYAAGLGLHQMSVALMGLALVVALLATLLFGYMQPHARYQYRNFLHQIEESSLLAAFKVSTFIRSSGATIFVEDTSQGVDHLGKIFIYQEDEDGKEVITTVANGSLSRSEDGRELFLTAEHGQKVNITKRDGAVDELTFQDIHQRLAIFEQTPFRDRGKGVRELTLPELWALRGGGSPTISSTALSAELHGRLAQIMSILFLPLIAIPLALGGGRGGQVYGVVIGMLGLIMFEQILMFGESLAASGYVSPWLGIWGIIFGFAVLSLTLFLRAAFHVSGDPWSLLDGVTRKISSLLARKKTPQGETV